MKINAIIIFLIISLISCEKENSTINFKGYWVNLSENKDTLLIKDYFIFRTNFRMPDSSLNHRYKYDIIKDSLVLTYDGFDKVYFSKPFINKFYYTKAEQILTIEDFEKVYPGYKGDVFKRIKLEGQ